MLLYRVVSRTTYNHLECTDEPGVTIQVAAALTGSGSLRPTTTRRSTGSLFDDDESSGRFSFSTRPTNEPESSTPQPTTTPTSAATTSSVPTINTSPTFVANAATSTSSTAGAMRTAEAIFGVGGSMVGLLAILL